MFFKPFQGTAADRLTVNLFQINPGTAGQTYKIYDSMSPLTFVKQRVTGGNYQTTFGSASTTGLAQMQLYSANLDGQTGLAFDAMGIPYSYNSSTGLAARPASPGGVFISLRRSAAALLKAARSTGSSSRRCCAILVAHSERRMRLGILCT